VRVVDEAGTPLPDGHLGEIEVRGGSVGAGYLDDSSAVSTRCDGALRTGDAGFLLHGELYVVGRLGDRVKVRGKSIFAEDVELALKQTGAPAHRQAVVLGERGGVAVAVAVLETPEDDWLTRARQLLRAACPGLAAEVIAAPPGTIPRTSSGKRMRRKLWQAFAAGELDRLR
jgi:acyl-CoA synthetase (AMP-forming)/AMP-acid ligase II